MRGSGIGRIACGTGSGERGLAGAGFGLMLAALVAPGSSVAAELGHYSPAILNIRDVLVPQPGFYYAQYNALYQPDMFRDRNGDSVRSLTLGGRTIEVDVDIDVIAIAPTFIYVTDWKVLGGRYGLFVSQTIGKSSVQAAVQGASGLGAAVDNDAFGLGDLFVQPVFLGWDAGSLEFSFGYGIYAPIGKYDGGSSDNIGLGYWEHQFQFAGAWHLNEQRTAAVVGAVTYEISHNKEDADIRPGDRLTLNYGASHYIPLDQKFMAEVGLAGFSQWQVTDDTGSDARNKDIHDEIHAIGLQAGITYLPWKAGLTFRWQHEYAAENRLAGDWFILNFGKAF